MASLLEPFESALDEIVRERRALDAGEAAWLSKVADYSRSGVWQADGYVNAAAAIRDRCHMTRKSASGAVHLAGKLGRLPAMAAAFSDGAISRDHALAVTRAYTRDREVELDGMDRAFAEYAVLVNPDELRAKVKFITDAIDGDGGAADDEEIFEQRRLDSSRLLGGVVGDWFLDREGGDIVNTAIAAQVATANVEGDPRTAKQRRADALVDICRLSLASDHHPDSAPKRRKGIPSALMVIDIRTFETELPDLVAAIRAEAHVGGGLSRATIERMLCDCDINRVIMDGPSEILDLGRTTREPSDKQFKALVARDKHCTEPGCNIGWQFCQPHHIRHWIHGGPTDLANLKLLCWYHHRQQHKHDAQARAG